MKPKRIQRQRIRGWKMPEGAVYVGRPSKWGNPFKVGAWVRPLRHGRPSSLLLVNDGLPLPITDAEMAVKCFAANALEPEAGYIFRQNVRRELRGKDLACWCSVNQPCHADILLEIANETAPGGRDAERTKTMTDQEKRHEATALEADDHPRVRRRMRQAERRRAKRYPKTGLTHAELEQAAADLAADMRRGASD